MGRVRGHGGRFLLVIFLFMCLEMHSKKMKRKKKKISIVGLGSLRGEGESIEGRDFRSYIMFCCLKDERC